MDICTATSGMTWGNFQSVIQLSAGLNAAFYALADFLNDVPLEKRRLKVLVSELKYRSQKTREQAEQLKARPESGDTIDAGSATLKAQADKDRSDLSEWVKQAQALSGKLDASAKLYAGLAHYLFRPACLLAFLESVFLLFYSSYLFDCSISSFGTFFVYLSIVPFLSAVAVGAAVFIYLLVSVTFKRRSISRKLQGK